MFFLNHLITLLCAVLLVSILGCFSTSKKEEINNQEIIGSYIDDDSAITAKVKAAIFEEPSLKSDEIGVETIRGTVRLTGFVN